MDERVMRDLAEAIALLHRDLQKTAPIQENNSDTIKKYGARYEVCAEQMHKDSRMAAKNGFLNILSQSQHDYTTVKLAYFKKEITAEQFYEITRDIVENVSRIGNEHLGSKVDDSGMVLSVWKDKVRADMEDVRDKIHGYGKE